VFASLTHTCTGQCVIVPLSLPPDTPIIEHGPSWIDYNYGSDVVRVNFLGDGSVDVIYNTGLLRAP